MVDGEDDEGREGENDIERRREGGGLEGQGR